MCLNEKKVCVSLKQDPWREHIEAALNSTVFAHNADVIPENVAAERFTPATLEKSVVK